MLGAVMWVAYGLLMQAAPVVAANVLVLAAAAWTARRAAAARTDPAAKVAARLLGLTRGQLRLRLEKYGLTEG